MKFLKKWRANFIEAAEANIRIYLPIRLDYSAKTYSALDPNKIVDYKYKFDTFERDLTQLLGSVFGASNIVRDGPATIIDVVETRSKAGYYGGHDGYPHGCAEDIELRIKILGPSDSGRQRVVRDGEKLFRVSPLPSITIYPGQTQYVGDVKGNFPRKEIETWLRNFPSRKAE